MTTEEKPQQPKPSIEELRADIKQTRAELGQTVQALAAKADVKARAKDQVEIAKVRALDGVEQAKVRARGAVAASPVPLPLMIAGVAAIVGIILVIRGRKR